MRKITSVGIDIENPDSGAVLFSFPPIYIEIEIEGDDTNDLNAKMEQMRTRMKEGISIYFPKYTDRIEKTEKSKA